MVRRRLQFPHPVSASPQRRAARDGELGFRHQRPERQGAGRPRGRQGVRPEVKSLKEYQALWGGFEILGNWGTPRGLRGVKLGGRTALVMVVIKEKADATRAKMHGKARTMAGVGGQ